MFKLGSELKSACTRAVAASNYWALLGVLCLLPQTALANELGPPLALMRQCVGLFIDTEADDGVVSEALDYAAWNTVYYKNLMGTDRGDDLSLRANLPSTYRTHRQADGSERYVYDRRMGDLYSSLRNPQSPLQVTYHLVPAPRVDIPNFYEAVYANYADAFKPELISMLHRIDDALTPERTMHVRIRKTGATERENLEHKPATESIYGTVRVYDGSMNPFGLQFAHAQTSDGAKLPLELANEARGLVPLKIQPLIDRYREQGSKIIEFSKLSVTGPTGSFRRRTRNVLDLFYLQWLATPYPDAVFFAHVVTEAHARHYVTQYGFEIAEHIAVEGSPQGEWILWAPGWKFAESLRERLNIPTLTSPSHPQVRWNLPRLNTSSAAD